MADNNYMFASIADIQQLLSGAAASPSLAMLNNVMAGTIGMSMHNAVTTQHNAQMLSAASTTSTCARILSVTAPVIPQPPPTTPAAPLTPPQASTPSTAPVQASTPGTPVSSAPGSESNDGNNSGGDANNSNK